jgi:hypothetical protein
MASLPQDGEPQRSDLIFAPATFGAKLPNALADELSALEQRLG